MHMHVCQDKVLTPACVVGHSLRTRDAVREQPTRTWWKDGWPDVADSESWPSAVAGSTSTRCRPASSSRTSTRSASSSAASAANVAVAAARLGHTRGADHRGRRRPLPSLRAPCPARPIPVSTTGYVGCRDGEHRRRSPFARSSPRDFPLYFYRKPTAPTCRCGPTISTCPRSAGADLFWTTVTGLSEEPSRSAHHAAWAARDRRRHTVLDLDFRPMFWASHDEATAQVRAACRTSPWL